MPTGHVLGGITTCHQLAKAAALNAENVLSMRVLVGAQEVHAGLAKLARLVVAWQLLVQLSKDACRDLARGVASRSRHGLDGESEGEEDEKGGEEQEAEHNTSAVQRQF